MSRGDELRKAGDLAAAAAAYEEELGGLEVPAAADALKVARCYARLGDPTAAHRWLLRIVDDPGGSYTTWQLAGTLLAQLQTAVAPAHRRRARVALVGSATLEPLGTMLRLAASRRGVWLDLTVGGYGQYRQELLDPASAVWQAEPQVVIIAVDHRDLDLPELSEDPEADIERELQRWRSLWQLVGRRSSARVIQHNFALPPDTVWGHLNTRLAGTRRHMVGELNDHLGRAAGNDVLVLDCESLSALAGKRAWFADRHWYASKHAIGPDCLPLVGRHQAALIAGDLGLTRKCLVLDLDNTLWGGVVGEDGLAGLQLGHGAAGEAFVAFQDHVLALRRRGVLLAVCSKNDEHEARRVFQEHPDMRLDLDDIAVFMANWEPKPDNLRTIATRLGIGLDSLVFVDDNPAERALVRQRLPEVEVIPLPTDPAGYPAALTDALWFETTAFTREDTERAQQYQARARAAELQSDTESLDDFYASLQMQARVTPFDDFNLPRVVQLIGKTNQFNLTTRRHGMADVRAMLADPQVLTYALALRDRFADQGLVGVLIARVRDTDLVIDTWLMSCRVIGRTVERTLFAELARAAVKRGCRRIVGTYSPTAKNSLVKDFYRDLGFAPLAKEGNGTTTWSYALDEQMPPENPFIMLEESVHDAA